MAKRRTIKHLVPPGKAPNKLSVKPNTSLKLSRKVIGAFHALQERRAAAPAGVALRALDAEEAALGGRQAYQAAAALSTAAFKASRWVFKTLTAAGLQPGHGELPLRVLELGAVNAQLSACPWLRVRAIDLLSRDEIPCIPMASRAVGDIAARVIDDRQILPLR